MFSRTDALIVSSLYICRKLTLSSSSSSSNVIGHRAAQDTELRGEAAANSHHLLLLHILNLFYPYY